MEQVILVDKDDNATGTMEKLQAHVEGLLHRAISVFIFNTRGELLLQQRAGSKYHSALLWTNTCCSHPRPGEDAMNAAARRLDEEMGISCPLTKAFTFTYRAELDNGLTEHEFDHVFTGITDDMPLPDGDEVAAWRYVSYEELQAELTASPELFTEWFKICIDKWHKKLFTTNNDK